MLTSIVMLVSINPAMAQPAASEADRRTEANRVFQEAMQASQKGPAEVKLSGQGVIKIPETATFIPQPHAARVLNAMGNPGDRSDLAGLIFPIGQGSWFVTVRFEKSGYIKDDDAKNWNVEEMMQSFRDGTEASNPERIKMGVTPMEIVGWAEKPVYDAKTHRLVWAMSSKDKGAPITDDLGVNYNTYMLGREGYFSLNLVTDLKELPQNKPIAAQLLSQLNFDDGKRYSDFDSKTDKIAEYGLAALVVGVAGKKLGLIAVILAFMAKFSKVLLLGAAVFGGGIMQFFKRRSKNKEIDVPMTSNSESANQVVTPAQESDPSNKPAENKPTQT
jgi:uncharacterized membrane-anchored protein